MTDKDRLKNYLLEEKFPYFDDTAITTLLDMHDQHVGNAAYDGCLQKAQDDSITLGPIQIKSNENFWLRRAQLVREMEKTYQRKHGIIPPPRTVRRYDD